ncbi:exopolyphosphatase [Slackia piriformis]|jgi:exopolyphosphatase/guanosine-5'-triphosphate,3'-diphosphate pyrophosphatase|nr:exopolyphosphatase [Slackia piriformis]
MPNYGIIDLGSNTVRMCIYEVRNSKQTEYRKKKDFRTIINHKIMAGLAAHVEDGLMTAQGIDHAVSVLSGHLRRAEYFNCKRLDIFATAVLRNCDNSHEAVRLIERRIGHDIRILSCADEAHLGFVGAMSAEPLGDGTLIDIGGGSTELTCIRDGKDSNNVSIGQGSLSSYANHIDLVLPTEEEARAIVDAFDEKLEETVGKKRDRYRSKQFYGVGGAVRAAAKMLAEVDRTERPEVITPEDLDRIVELYRENTRAFAHLAVKATPDRVHTLLPGCLILRRALREFGAENVRVCGGGVREGYLIERILKGVPKP